MIMRLRIADTIISLKSVYPMQPVEQLEAPEVSRIIAAGLAYAGQRKADLKLKVLVGRRLRETRGRRRLFRMFRKSNEALGGACIRTAKGIS